MAGLPKDLPPPNLKLVELVSEALSRRRQRGFHLVVCTGNVAGSMAQLGDHVDGTRVVSIVLPSHTHEVPGTDAPVIPREIVVQLGAVLGTLGAYYWSLVIGTLVSAGALGWLGVRALLEHMDRAESPSPVNLVEACLASVVQRGPTVLTIAGVAGSPAMWRFLCHEVDSLDTGGQPLVVVCTLGVLRQMAGDANEHEPDDPIEDEWDDVASQVDHLVDRGRASWCPILPLDASGIVSWIGPIEDDAGALLLRESGGDDVVAALYWQWWRRHDFVVLGPEGWWVPDPMAEPVEAAVSDAIVRCVNPADYGIAWTALTCGGVAGGRFSGDAIALVAASMTGASADEVNDVLDALSPPRDAEQVLWVIKEEGAFADLRPDGTPIFRWRYGFTMQILAAYFSARTTGRDRRQLADRVYGATVGLHANDHELAIDLASLARTAGRNRDARHFERLSRALDRDRELIAYAQVCLFTAADEDPDDSLAQELTELTNQLLHLAIHDLSVPAGEHAVAVAMVVGNEIILAEAQLAAGTAQVGAWMPRKALGTSDSPGPLFSAKSFYESEFARSSHPNARSGLAASLYQLGAAELGQGHYPEAIDWLKRAREHWEALYSERPLSGARSGEL
jgi:hypothetical protein